MMRVRSFCGLVCAALLATAGSAAAQEFRATIKGTVVDTSQAALPGATVTAQNQDTNEVASATTNNEGAYTIPFLRPGNYTLTVELAGFQKNSRSNLRLSVGETANINVQLGVGLTETVNVVSETPLLETSKASTTTPRRSTCVPSTTARSPTGR
jgi:Carboxypeptidase regulatory-like domain